MFSYPQKVRLPLLFSTLMLLSGPAMAQIDPYHRNLLQLGYDQSLKGDSPRALYAFYYYNNPEIRGTNTALRLAIAPAYVDGELGFRQLLSPTTDVGIGFNGGIYGDSYYEARQGHYLKGESFDGHGGGISLAIYQLINPGMLIPVSLVGRGGFRYSIYDDTDDTDPAFVLPEDRPTVYVRGGLRVAGKEPVLYPDLGLELSIWYERQWRGENGNYGFAGDRRVEPTTELFWLYAGMDYSWTNIGHHLSVAVTVGGSSQADRFSAWRLGGVLPLVSEFPLILPGYYYQELTATRFAHFYASYQIPLDRQKRFNFRLEAASALIEYLPGLEQPKSWQTGAGCGLSFTPASQKFRVVLRYGYGFNALRSNGEEGAHSVGMLFQYDFGHRLLADRGDTHSGDTHP